MFSISMPENLTLAPHVITRDKELEMCIFE